ncbi:hypothetical protein FRC11_003107 [Ceratobasidium sp. 423]|nr:hypothetical protein FRC11_003107 [Ceratobasidium sp. 423]
MIAHLIAGDNNELPADRIFQFNQWDRNKWESSEEPYGSWIPQIVYRPDSKTFVRAMSTASDEQCSTIPEMIAPDPTLSVPYQSFSHVALETYQKTLADNDKWWDLQAALSDHDQSCPVPAKVEFWHQRAQLMPLLEAEPPLPQFAGNHLVSKAYLPVSWFNENDPDHKAGSLSATLQWCQPNNWLDSRSETILGGYLGVKWATVVLGHLQRNVQCWKSEPAKWNKHFDKRRGELGADVIFAFTDGQIRQIEDAIDELRRALVNSTLRLRQARLAPVRLDELVMRASLSSHLNFPTTSAQFVTTSCMPPLDDWDEYHNQTDPPTETDISEGEEVGTMGRLADIVEPQRKSVFSDPTKTITQVSGGRKRRASREPSSVSPHHGEDSPTSAEKQRTGQTDKGKQKQVSGPGMNTRSGKGVARASSAKKKQKV